MPKETTHFLVGLQTYRELIQDEFWKPLKGSLNELYLGSIFPDVLYGALDIKDKRMIEIPDNLHGSRGEDTLALIKNCCGSICDGRQMAPSFLAFLVGIVTHVFTDVTFHPLVYYYSGNYYDENLQKRQSAVIAHRKLESVMDLYFAGGYQGLKDYQIGHMLRQVADLRAMIEKISACCFKENAYEVAEAMHGAYTSYAKLREMYTTSGFQFLVSVVDRFAPPGLRELTAACYHSSELENVEKISGQIEYRDPVSGAHMSTTLNQLQKTAIDLSVNYCALMKNFLLNKNADLLNVIGPSLETGKISCAAACMTYFSGTALF